MYTSRAIVIALLPLFVGVQACAQLPAVMSPPSGQIMPHMDQASGDQAPKAEGRTDLPFAEGRTFANLDAYLAYRRELGTSDRATWYDEVSPGVYQFVARGLLPGQRRTFSRAELLAEFGFED